MDYPIKITRDAPFDPIPAAEPPTRDEPSQERTAPVTHSVGGSNVGLALALPRIAPVCGFKRFGIFVDDRASQSFTDAKSDANTAVVEPGLAFAPGVDAAQVGWNIKIPGEVGSLKVELIRSDKQPVTLKKADYAADELEFLGKYPRPEPSHDFTGTIGFDQLVEIDDAAEFPGGVPTIQHSPYLLKVTLTATGEQGYPLVGWTHFHVLAAGLELEWFPDPRRVLPIAVPNPDDGVRLRHLEVNRSLADLADDQNLDGLVPGPGETKKVFINANVFYQGESELKGQNNQYFTKLRALWGDGPMVPLLCKVKVQNAAGDAVDAPDAVGKVKLLWDWVDRADPNPQGATPQIHAFLDRLMRHQQAASADAPAGMNCHVDRGGKRGPGGAPVFPAQPGTAPVNDLPDPGDAAATFPFNVAQCATRTWAAISETWAEGCLKGKSGVIFQPSRMAGDAYALNVLLIASQESDAVTGADAPDAYPAALRASTGTFRVWHSVECINLIQIGGGGGGNLDFDALNRDLSVACCRLEYDDAKRIDGTARFQAGMLRIYNGPLRNQLAPYLQDALPLAPVANQSLIEFKSFTDFKTACVARAGNPAAAYAASRNTANPTNAAGEDKFDWHARTQFGVRRTPLQEPWPIDHTTEVATTVDGSVRVVFLDPARNATEHTVVFETGKRVVKSKNNTVSAQDKHQLARLYADRVRDANGQYPPYDPANHQPITVELHGKTAGAGNQTRLQNIRAALDEIVEDSWNREDPMRTYPTVVGAAVVGAGLNPSAYQNTAAFEWVWTIIQLVLFDQFPAAAGGMYLLQIQGQELCNFNGPKAKAMFADATGSRIIVILSPTARKPTLEHEIGHCRFLNHTYVTQDTSDPLELHQEDVAGSCIMKATGCGDADRLCGICLLRLRGWSIFNVTNPAAGTFDLNQKVLNKDGT